MGRPIKKKYFGNLNVGGISGAGVATFGVAVPGTLYASTATLVFGAPNDPLGVQATGTLTVNTSTGAISSVTLTNAGSGYTSAPSVTVSPATTGTSATFSVVLGTSLPDITVSAWVTGGSVAKAADIKKQESSHRYLVRNVRSEEHTFELQSH